MNDEDRSALDNPSISIADALSADMFGGVLSESGTRVNKANALQFVAVFACVRIIAETIASLPLNVYERKESGRRLASEHPVYALMHDSPNEWMTSLVFRETMLGHVLLTGNAYAAIGYDGAGQPMELLPLDPTQVAPKIVNRRKVYDIQGLNFPLADSQILHIPGLGFDGLVGYSVLAHLRNAIGLGVAGERYASKVFANDASVGAVLESPAKLSDKAFARLREQWRERHSGANAHSTAILEEGAKLTRLGLPTQDALFLEGRKFQIEEIARFYRVPPHMLAMLDRSTNSNIEQQALDFEKHTLRRWLIAWEQECNRKLFPVENRRRYYVEHNLDGLLRGDIATRYNTYAIGRNWGWLSVNDIRQRENMDPIPGGDTYLAPGNMVPADQLGKEPVTTKEPAMTAIDANQSGRMLPVLAAAIRRLMKPECEAVARASKSGDYAKEMTGFNGEHVSAVTRELLPVCEAMNRPLMRAVGLYLDLRNGFDPEADAEQVAKQLMENL